VVAVWTGYDADFVVFHSTSVRLYYEYDMEMTLREG